MTSDPRVAQTRAVFTALHVIIDAPLALAGHATSFWSVALGWSAGDPWPEHPEFRSLIPPTGTPYVHVQTADRKAMGIHLDVAADDLDRTAAALVTLGAQPGLRYPDWHRLKSPGGLPLCTVPSTPMAVPPPYQTDDGNRLRLVQVCLDVPQHLVPAEVDFWRAASGWRWARSPDEAFAGKLYHDGTSPVQLLVQRLGRDDPGLRTRAHLDLGADDIEHAVDRLVDLGAVRGDTGDGWVVLTDPTGMTFCVTGNAPV